MRIIRAIITGGKLAILFAALLGLSACDSMPVGSNPKNSAGMTEKEAREKSLNLRPGMNSVAVVELLGNPDKTSSGTYGTKTDKPWQGVTYVYEWKKDSYSSIRLMITFQYERSPNGTFNYYINSWNWY